MAFRREDYPADWQDLRARSRDRSGDACEHSLPGGGRCGAPNGAMIHRLAGDQEIWFACSGLDDCLTCRSTYTSSKPARVVLTTAHTCQDSTCGNEDHLKFWCQLHHLRYDAPQHGQEAARTRARRRRQEQAGAGQLALETGGGL